MLTACAEILRLDVRVAVRDGAALVPLAFFLLVMALAPIIAGGDPALTARISGGTAWFGALLAFMLSVDRMFRPDIQDGSLRVLRGSGIPMEAIALAKCAAGWLTTGAALVFAAPAAGILLGLTGPAACRLAASLAAGTPALALLAGLAASLTASMRTPGLLAPLIAAPLAAPALLFGGVAANPEHGASGQAMLFLAAFSLAAAAVAPPAIASVLRQAEG